MSLNALLVAHLRGTFAVDAPRPDWIAGLRAATAMMLPLAAGWTLQRPELVWAALGGWLGMLADPGGPYPARAAAMAAFAALGASASAAGGLLGATPAIALPALFLVCLVCSLMRVRGDTAGTIGVLALTMFCITQASPAGLRADLERALSFAAGALLALGLSLFLWPFRPYRPVRTAVAECWTRIAELAKAAARLAEGAQPAPWETLFALRRKTREALERARAALGAARAGRQGETGRGLQLLVLYEIAELTLGDVAAAAEALHVAAEEGHPPDAAIARGLDEVGGAQHAVAQAILRVPVQVALDLEDREAGRSPAVRARDSDAARFLRKLRAETRQAMEAATALNGVGSGAQAAPSIALQEEIPRLRDAVARGSIELRHALRVAIVATTAASLSAALHLQRSYWVTLTVIIVLQPHAVATVKRALQRVGGTVVGGMAAALIARAAHSPLVLAPILFGLAWLAVAVRRMNYAAFAALLTPVFVLLAETTAGEWHLTAVRILNTMLGGALALGGALMLWPARELERVGPMASALLEADLGYLRAVLRGDERASIIGARRRIGLATANAEAALQRLIGEGAPSARIEPLMALVAYARRLSASITALGASRPSSEEAVVIEQSLARLVEAARRQVEPGPVPDLPVDSAHTPAAERALRQLRVVGSALARIAAR